ncbi:cilia- and flagella-associated protein 65-like [Daktulosphaira vitifoliae]|uniref:cilia- and flagella-associated protein 65-like n=1 Tax=Daktulosphaira vitifoliae TaxID=58002 RepID=UPI0021AA627D|nr:cilia- and flagella-associated protein 65-like [Daktulosphaira vitifoliae]
MSRTENAYPISLDFPYGTDTKDLEFHFEPVYIANPNPPAQAFWIYNEDSINTLSYTIIDDSLSPAFPHFHCLNPFAIVPPKSMHPLLFVFMPDRLSSFKATIILLVNGKKRFIVLSGYGESSTRTIIPRGHGMSSFLPVKNNREIYLSTESLILRSFPTQSEQEAMFCLYNDTDDDIQFEWRECYIENILFTKINPDRGTLKGSSIQMFVLKVKSYDQPVELTMMLNMKYNFLALQKKYEQSLKTYHDNENKLKGVFIIKEHDTYIPKLKTKTFCKPQENHLVMNVHLRTISNAMPKQLDHIYSITKKFQDQYEKINHNKFNEILWSIVDKLCTEEIKKKPLYNFYMDDKGQSKTLENFELSKSVAYSAIISMTNDILLNLYPLEVWKI